MRLFPIATGPHFSRWVLRISSVLRVPDAKDRALTSAGFTRVHERAGRWGMVIERTCYAIPVASGACHISVRLRGTVEQGPIRLLRFPVDPKMGSGNGAGDALGDGLYLAIETMPTRI